MHGRASQGVHSLNVCLLLSLHNHRDLTRIRIDNNQHGVCMCVLCMCVVLGALVY